MPKKRFTFRIKGVDPWYGYTEAFKIAHHAYVVSCEESRHSLLKLPTMLGVVFATRGFNLFLCFSHEAIVYFFTHVRSPTSFTCRLSIHGPRRS